MLYFAFFLSRVLPDRLYPTPADTIKAEGGGGGTSWGGGWPGTGGQGAGGVVTPQGVGKGRWGWADHPPSPMDTFLVSPLCPPLLHPHSALALSHTA